MRQEKEFFFSFEPFLNKSSACSLSRPSFLFCTTAAPPTGKEAARQRFLVPFQWKARARRRRATQGKRGSKATGSRNTPNDFIAAAVFCPLLFFASGETKEGIFEEEHKGTRAHTEAQSSLFPLLFLFFVPFPFCSSLCESAAGVFFHQPFCSLGKLVRSRTHF